MDVSDEPNFFVKPTPILGLKLYILIALTVLLLVAFFVLLFFFLRNRAKSNDDDDHVTELIQENTTILPLFARERSGMKLNDHDHVHDHDHVEEKTIVENGYVSTNESSTSKRDQVRERKNGFGSTNESSTGESSSALSASNDNNNTGGFGWGKWYGLKELENATNGFSEESIVGKGGYGVVYRGVLDDGHVVAIKNLNNNKGQAEREFRVEVEAIGKVRHKYLVCLIGYCAEGAQRLLVYEYIDNGNLEQWLHGDVGPVSPLTWEIRMKIAWGTAQGLAYLHEGLEPKVIHRDVKSSNILLDKKWDPKVSDFGLAKLLESEKSYITTRVMGTFGYVSPDYASTGMLNEANDVYSFGILLMEIITGRKPVDYARPPGEKNLIHWIKEMISNRRAEELIDPLIDVHPPSRVLQRILLVCLRCTDVDPNRRPKMGHVVHMLVSDDFSTRNNQEDRSVRDTAPLHPRANGNM